MSYMLTDVCLYGVTLSYEQALRVLQHTGNVGFFNELENEFQSMTEEFGQLDVFDMKSYYDELECGLVVNYPYKTFHTLVEFFDYFSFCRYQVPPHDRQTIPTVFDKHRDIQYHRLRYFVDLFSLDADSRGDSLRCIPGRESVYGVYIASDGYAYNDDFRTFDSDPRIEINFAKYCLPVLQELELTRDPQRIIIQQTW